MIFGENIYSGVEEFKDLYGILKCNLTTTLSALDYPVTDMDCKN